MDNLRKVQLCELEILKAVVDCCNKHHLQYWLAYGTLLGAIRHQGFIPWDDDIDIYLTVKDLRRFVKIAKKELKDKYFVQCPYTENMSRWMFCKVRRNGSLFLQKEENEQKDFHQGLFIDIFPLVAASDNDRLLEFQMKLFFTIQKSRLQHPHFLREGNLVKEVLKHLYEALLRTYETFLYKLAIVTGKITKSSNYLAVGMEYNSWFPKELRRKERILINKRLINEVAQYRFEDAYFTSVRDYGKYLSQFFGDDYMTPKQYGNHASKYDNVIFPKDWLLELSDEYIS